MDSIYMKIAIGNCMLVFASQLIYTPILAWKIHKRFEEISIDMEASVFLSFTSFTKFWGEARELYKETEDEKIYTLLRYRNGWFWYLGFSCILFLIAIILT